MANTALLQCAAVSLQLDEFNLIIGLGAGSNGMRAVVAGGAVKTTMILGHAVKGLILIVEAVIMTGITAWLVQPGVSIL